MGAEQLSGDSTVWDLRFAGGVAALWWEDGDSGRRFRLRVATDCLYSEAAGEAGTVRAELVPLADTLPVDSASGRYTAPAGFGPLMAAVREGNHLALGRRAAEYPFLLQVRGHTMVLACPARSAAAVEVLPDEPAAWRGQ